MSRVILAAVVAALVAGCQHQAAPVGPAAATYYVPVYYNVPVYTPVYNYVEVPVETSAPTYTYAVKTNAKGKTTTSWSVKW